MKRIIPLAVVTLAALGFSPSAAALSCDEIVGMLAVNVPANIVVQTMKDSGAQFSAQDMRCLQDNNAPDAVMAQARQMIAREPDDLEPDDETPVRRTMEDDEDRIESDRRDDLRNADLESDEPSSGADPEAIKEAIKYLKANKPLSASQLLYDLLEDKSFPDQEDKINYYMGKALADLELYHSAQYHYLQVIQQGPQSPFFSYALSQLVSIARLTGDDYDLARIATRLDPNDFPRGAKNHFFYLKGVKAYQDGKLAEAEEYFGQISTKSTHYLKAKYFEGVINNEQGKLKTAVKDFRDVYREEPESFTDPRELVEVERLKDLSLINIARIYYRIERFDEANRYYNLVNHDSSYWPQALFEQSYTNFMLGDLNKSLGLILTVNSPQYRTDSFLPETTILKALTFFNLCAYQDVEKILLDFESRYTPMRDELRSFVEGYSSEEGKKIADQAWNTYFGDDKQVESTLPKSFFTRVLRNQDLSGLVRHMNMMDTEVGLINEQKSRWQDTVGSYLKRIIERDRAKYERRAGLLMLHTMAEEANYLSELLTQSEIIRFEVIDAERVDYMYRADNTELLDTSGKLTLDFATAVDFIYWPFNGEFWEDELGYYNYTEQGSCN